MGYSVLPVAPLRQSGNENEIDQHDSPDWPELPKVESD
jgi:hypothetical protein